MVLNNYYGAGKFHRTRKQNHWKEYFNVPKNSGLKASDMAERLGMKEATYSRYERGESALTVDVVQQIAEALKIDPLMLLSFHPSNFLEIGSNSPNASITNNGSYNFQTTNEQQTQMMLKLMENVMVISERLISMLDKNAISR